MNQLSMNQINFNNNPFEVNNFVGGEWVKGSAGKIDIISPYTGRSCGAVNLSLSQDIDMAVLSAKKNQPAWAMQSLKARTQVMFKFRDILLRDIEVISEVIALESGKTIGEAKAGLMKGLEVLEYALSLQNLDSGGKMEVSRGVFCEYRREPLGVVASITPFNFPAMVPMWTIPISIVVGNAYIWKPSEKTPITSQYIANAFHEAGLPAGILTVVQGAKEAVEALVDHEEVKAVAFVGSTKIAKQVYVRATGNGKRALCLGGAKNHILLLPDADLEVSGVGISDSFTGCAGQRCMAASVLLAVGDVDSHIEKIKAQSLSQVLGKTMGAIISKEQLEFLNESIAKAVDNGAKVILDGRNPKLDIEVKDELTGGFWLGPTILDDIKSVDEMATLELFGPILAIVRCKNITEAIEIQNKSPYGNAASVFTSSGPIAELVASKAQCGMFGVNIGVPVPREPFSFAGTGASKFGHGEITGNQSVEFWSNLKKITTKWEAQTDSNWMS